jgi:hypothetical protein
MQRREFIAGLGAAITGSIRAHAQELPPVQLVGYLYAGPTDGVVGRQVAFREGLGDAGYFEGCNVAVESRWARNVYYRLPDLANDLVSTGVSVLVRHTMRPRPSRRRRQPPRFQLSSVLARTPSRPASFPAWTILGATSPASPP